LKVFYPVFILVAAASAWDFSYDLTMDVVKETTTLTNTFAASNAISRTVSLNGNGTFTAKRAEGLSQFTDYRSGSGWLNWNPLEGIEMSTTFTRAISLEDRFGARVRDDRTDSATGAIRYSRGSWLNTNVAVGIRTIDYLVSTGQRNNDGDFYRISSTVNKTILNGINTSIGFTENRSYGNETNNFSDGIQARVSYYFPDEFMGGSLNADISGDRYQIIEVDSLVNTIGEAWSHSESLELPVVIPGVFIDFSTTWSNDTKYYESAFPDSIQVDPRDDDRSLRSLNSNMFWEMTENIELDFSFARTLGEMEKITEVYGSENTYLLNESNDNKQLNVTLTYSPGGARIVFQRLVELYSFDTMIDNGDTSSVYTNDFDKDEYRELIGITSSIPLSSRFTITCGMNGQQRSAYYIMASQSANSNTASTYTFNPGYRYDIGNNWKLDQNIKLTASYTNYLFPEATRSEDRLSRRLDEFFSLSRVSSDSTSLGISHRFTFSDQGTMENDIFLRAEESLNNSITLNGGFHVSSNVGITPSYSYQYVTRNRMDLMIKTVDNLHHVGIRSAIAVMGGMLNANITRTFYSSSSRESYWNASVGFNIRM
jgi:hypothetical protein